MSSTLEIGDRVEVALVVRGPRGFRGTITDRWIGEEPAHADLYEVSFDKDRAIPYVTMPKANFPRHMIRKLSVLELIAEAAQ